MKRIVSTLWLVLMFRSLKAQSAEMADLMRSEGKIYVVVGVVVLIFAVLFAYLIYIDQRLKRLEKERKKS